MARDLEHQHQRAVIDWWAWACKGYGLPDYSLFAVPNGGARSKRTAGRLKAEGVRAGVYDLEFPVALGGFHGLRSEMKSQTGRQTPAQQAFGAWAQAQGWRVEVAYSSTAAINALQQYLDGGARARP